MSSSRSAVVIGASSGVGRAMAESLAEYGYDLVISARDEVELRAVASDIQLRFEVEVAAIQLDLCWEDEQLEAYLSECTARAPQVEVVLFPAGAVDDADDGTTSWELSQRLVTTNFLAITKLAGRFISQFESQDRGTVVFVSSIAAAAPRRRNVAYAAAKSALESYGRSMQHRLADENVHVQIYRLGYVDTAMSRGQRLLLPAAPPERVARELRRHLGRGHRFAHYPRYWSIITFLLQRLPWFVYKRLRF